MFSQNTHRGEAKENILPRQILYRNARCKENKASESDGDKVNTVCAEPKATAEADVALIPGGDDVIRSI